MAKADIWMPLYIGDYLADTTRLTTEQHGAYLLLIMDYWRNGSPPDDDSILANITRMSVKDWNRIKVAVLTFFTLIEGDWYHSRIEKEITDALSGKQKAEEKARKAAEARWGNKPSEQLTSNAPSNAPSIDQALLKECPSPSPSSLKPKSIRRNSTDEPEGFSQFWQAWPKTDRKTAKAECCKRWKAKGLEADAEPIIADVLRRIDEDRQWRDGFEPAPLTYINQRRWEDAPANGGIPAWDR